MSDEQNAELLAMVRSLTDRIESLELEVKSLRVLHNDAPEETLVAIAAAVAAYLGHRAQRRVRHFNRSTQWLSQTRRAQHVHAPLHLR